LPTELLYAIFEVADTQSLCMLRATCSRFDAIATVVLLARVKQRIAGLQVEHAAAARVYKLTEMEQTEYLLHYQGFLVNIPSSLIDEAQWYHMPPEEVQTVCECLCILQGDIYAIAENKPVTSRVEVLPKTRFSWSTIKKSMARPSFKRWIQQLPTTGVDKIPFTNVKIVERIIMRDPQVTYERLRVVNRVGHRLLIIVAACLQYCTIKEDLKVKRATLKYLDR
ncbi:hypothetical protein BC832DRAFT_523881, partial [Gaertneriomyces semiglobifer]